MFWRKLSPCLSVTAPRFSGKNSSDSLGSKFLKERWEELLEQQDFFFCTTFQTEEKGDCGASIRNFRSEVSFESFCDWFDEISQKPL